MGASSEKSSITPIILGHRGAPKLAPPNILSSFKKAIELGAEGVEFDIRLTKDKRLVVMHDPVVDNTTDGKGYVSNYTLRELKKLDAGGWFSKEFKGERIPTLEEALDILKNLEIINIEIKNDPVPYEGIEEMTLRVIYDIGLKEKVIISSFDHTLLSRIRRLDRDIETGVLYSCKPLNPTLLAIDAKATSLHPFWASMDEDTIRNAHNIGLRVFPWTVDEEVYIKRLIDWNVDGIITNNLEVGIKIKSEISSFQHV